jgi:hypothetical protein
MKYPTRFIVVALLTVLASCEPPPPNYAAPPSLTPDSAASIVGSMNAAVSWTVPSTEIAVEEVDNERNQSGLDGWEKPILVAPGNHVLTVFVCQCGLSISGTNISGMITLPVTVKPGGTYTIHSTNPTGPYYYGKTVIVWVEDGTGALITPKTKFDVGPPPPPIVQLFLH